MNKHFHSLAVAMAALTALALPFVSCGGGGGGETGGGGGGGETGGVVGGPGVYVAGFVQYDNYYTLWKNGVAQTLIDGWYGSVYVSGRDAYIVGAEAGHGATLWKNGTAQRLGVGVGASSVYVSGGDVYIAGTVRLVREDAPEGSREEYRATLWKNGTVQTLNGGHRRAHAESVAVSGGDVYVAGYAWFREVEDANLEARAMLWVNGTAQMLGDGESRAHSVAVSGGDVYVAGTIAEGHSYEDYINHATLWVNGTAQMLRNNGAVQYAGNARSGAYSVFVAE